MKVEDQIVFVSELLNLISELQALIMEHCQKMTAEQEDCMQENTTADKNIPF